MNELLLTRHRGAGGGTVKGRFDDAALFDAIASVVDAKAKPLTADDDRPMGQRQAEALADVCGYVLDHGDDVPESGGRRPHLNVLVRLEDLESDGVMVYDLTRFPRKIMEGERLVDLATNGVRVWALAGEYDLATADGRRHFREAMVAAAGESDKISERVQRGKLRRARKGSGGH